MDQPTAPRPADAENQAPIPFHEFVAMGAALMALTALGIDSMLPALPAIGADLGVGQPNHRQFVITAFLLGFGVAQLALGPLTDRLGRRPVLIGALGVAVLANLAAAASPGFEALLAARFVGGMATAGARVVVVAIVRDCFTRRTMAKVMSLIFMVFMAAPVLAPFFGQAVLAVARWPWIFAGIALVTALALAWFAVRMPETLPIEKRTAISMFGIVRGYRAVLSDRHSLGYSLAVALLSGGLFGFIGSIQPIMADVFAMPHLLGVVFTAIAGTMAAANFANAQIVERLGSRLVSHSALVALIGIAALHLGVALAGGETLIGFIVLQAAMMACFGLATSNFSAMAMDNMGAIAGTASSVQGVIATMGGALLGAAIGLAFDGTTVPLYLGFLVLGMMALGVVALTERGRLFRPI